MAFSINTVDWASKKVDFVNKNNDFAGFKQEEQDFGSTVGNSPTMNVICWNKLGVSPANICCFTNSTWAQATVSGPSRAWWTGEWPANFKKRHGTNRNTVGKYYVLWNISWLVVSNMNFIFHFIYGMSSFPLTHIFQRGKNYQPDGTSISWFQYVQVTCNGVVLFVTVCMHLNTFAMTHLLIGMPLGVPENGRTVHCILGYPQCSGKTNVSSVQKPSWLLIGGYTWLYFPIHWIYWGQSSSMNWEFHSQPVRISNDIAGFEQGWLLYYTVIMVLPPTSVGIINVISAAHVKR